MRPIQTSSNYTKQLVPDTTDFQKLVQKRYGNFKCLKIKGINEAYCKVCRIDVCGIPVNLDAHLNGKQHRKNVKTYNTMHGQSKFQDSGPDCFLCGGDFRVTDHHLIPKNLHARIDFPTFRKNETVPLCRTCHDIIHSQLSSTELAIKYNTPDALKMIYNKILPLIDTLKFKDITPSFKKSEESRYLQISGAMLVDTGKIKRKIEGEMKRMVSLIDKVQICPCQIEKRDELLLILDEISKMLLQVPD